MAMNKPVEIDGYPVQYYRLKDRPYHGTGNYRSLKLFLIEKYGVCFHCGTPVKDYPQVDGVRLPDDAATIDHLVPRTQRKRHQKVAKVLACYKCNWERGVIAHQRGRH